ncbi:uncharacterized protein LOC124812779 [Hydra vulgaris]|uniref:uncharacterized protein LOC124812779 n=1 Tax=Hydra vulgaris TaxID=6087 RepID=UPI001F5E60C3|nr:uncharacterized protein LOC124812779 [Hydra vulgaris]
MPGENCAIYGCSASRRNKGISFFKVPLSNSEFNKKWGDDLIHVITKDRVVDASLRERIRTRKLFIWEQHFSVDQYYIYDRKKSLKEGELPQLNLPCKSSPAVLFSNRSTSSIQKRSEHVVSLDNVVSLPLYKNFDDFVNRIVKLSIKNTWEIHIETNLVVITFLSVNHILPRYEIFVDDSLHFTLRVFGWILSEDHDLYKQFSRSFLNVTLSTFTFLLEHYELCKGIEVPNISKELQFQKHVIPKKFNYHDYQQLAFKPHLNQDQYFRSNNCRLLLNKDDINTCADCRICVQKVSSEEKSKLSTINKPAKLNAPIKFISPNRIKLTLQNNRLKCKQLEQELLNMRSAIEEHSETVHSQIDEDFKILFSACDQADVPNFMKLFWSEQQKYIQTSCSNNVKYHPMIIKFCLNLAAKSSSAYSDLRYDKKTGNGILVLPSLRTLRDYKHYIHPTRGFNPAVINDLKLKTESFTEPERFVGIIFDEMKIQEDLVWDKYSGELIGFVDLGDNNINYGTLKNVETIATYILVFLVKSIVNPLSFSFATFATTGILAHQIMPIFWKAVCYLELINLHVISTTSDGASSNRRFFKMHKFLQGCSDKDVIYRTKNIFSKKHHFIYFFADVPHLMKTARNCLSHSGTGHSTRLMWNNGFFLLWSHIQQIFEEQLESGLKFVPKLTNDHIHLTPYSAMKVSLAAQVLSETVGSVLANFGPPEAAGTSTFCIMMDKFFDCLNVRNTFDHRLKKKPFLKPYESLTDERYHWLDEFLEYLRLWKVSIETRAGHYNDNSKSKMFLSWQTYEGLKITVYSFKEVVKFLLENGLKYVLSERFCQDDLENYFGRQRAIGRRQDNPSVRDVGYNDNIIKSQFSIRPIAGNVHSNSTFSDISSSPLPKRKRLVKTNK